MLKRHNQILVSILFAFDIVIAPLTWILSYWLYFNLINTGNTPNFTPYLKDLYLIIPIWLVVFKLSDLYIPRRCFSIYVECSKIIKTVSIACAGLLIADYFFRINDAGFSRAVTAIFYVLNCLSLSVFRLIIRLTLRRFRKQGYNQRHALIIGGGNLGRTIIQKINSQLWTGFSIRGVLDDFIPINKPIETTKCIGTLDELTQIIEQQNIDQIFIALSFKHHKKIEHLLNLLTQEHVSVRLVPDIFQFNILLNSSIEDLDGIPIINLAESPITGWKRFAKRTFDIIFSLSVLILFSPLYLLLAILVKTSSKGPIFFKQKRMGIDGEIFSCYKFRSMPVNIEKESGPIWASKGDNRATPIGALMRKTSLDEFPQFFNVLRGDMSIVGPRPERPEFIKDFAKQIPRYQLRHKVKAGITGWAQINGWRGNTSIEKRIECDLYYINNWSLSFDIKIIFLTIFKGFVNTNAY